MPLNAALFFYLRVDKNTHMWYNVSNCVFMSEVENGSVSLQS